MPWLSGQLDSECGQTGIQDQLASFTLYVSTLG